MIGMLHPPKIEWSEKETNGSLNLAADLLAKVCLKSNRVRHSLAQNYAENEAITTFVDRFKKQVFLTPSNDNDAVEDVARCFSISLLSHEAFRTSLSLLVMLSLHLSSGKNWCCCVRLVKNVIQSKPIYRWRDRYNRLHNRSLYQVLLW